MVLCVVGVLVKAPSGKECGHNVYDGSSMVIDGLSMLRSQPKSW